MFEFDFKLTQTQNLLNGSSFQLTGLKNERALAVNEVSLVVH